MILHCIINLSFEFWYSHNVSLYCFPEIMIGFEHTFYTVNEDGHGVDMCAQFTGTSSGCSVDFPFAVSIQTVDDTAGILSCLTNDGVYVCYCFYLFQ